MAKINSDQRLTIGIIGGGFTGIALAATLQRLSKHPLEIIVFDKNGQFGKGPAYSTPFPHHLLNVRSQDMSAFFDEPTHFTDWINLHSDRDSYFDNQSPIAEQFAPRYLYYQYLQSLISAMQKNTHQSKVIFQTAEIIDIYLENEKVYLVTEDNKKFKVDKAILAIGNNPPSHFSFPVSDDIQCIHNPWDYSAIQQIEKHEPVLIVGTGLSMIDAVLTLHHQHHQGAIYALSRHGLLPLPHSNNTFSYPLKKTITNHLPSLTKEIRKNCLVHMKEEGDWRAVINALRKQVPKIWAELNLKDKKRFLRHILPYWNIHRHRVHTTIMELLTQLAEQQQLKILSGRISKVERGKANIKLRHSKRMITLPIKWLVNCMGPTQQIKPQKQVLLKALLDRKIALLDPLQLGLMITPSCALQDANHQASTQLFAVGAITKGMVWEITAVPEIRSQIFDLTRHLLAIK